MNPTLLLGALLLVHGTLHLLGLARGFDLGSVPLEADIGAGQGLLWLLAALLLVGAGGAALRGVDRWWIPALTGVVLSQALILGSWEEARWGTVANVIVLVPVLVAAADRRPGSLRSIYAREVAREAAIRARSPEDPGEPLAEAELDPLPEPVRRWLRRVEVVGRPVPRSVHVAFEARIRGTPDDPWMEGTADQHGFLDPPARLFYMTARRAGLPVHVLHRFVGDEATMEGRLLGLVPLFRMEGPKMTRSETVTLLNDLFFLVPAAVARAGIRWELVGDRTVRATWTHGGHTVSGVAVFDDHGDLVDFVSADRYQMDRDPPTLSRWRTPLRGHASVDGVRLPRAGEARWGEEGEDWPYVELEIEELAYDVHRRVR
jgi:hypothetical protein